MPKKTAPKKSNSATKSASRLMPPAGGATVRMYRTGHGDCFLLAFEGKTKAKPVYVLIDCGYKPGSPEFINTTIQEIAQSIRDATGGHIDIAMITHEHQDHVNGITEANFAGIEIGESWFAWTEDPNDDLANSLRKRFKDKLLGLLAARDRLAAAGDTDQVLRIDEFLAFELGGENIVFDAAAAAHLLGAADAAASSMNKKSMKIFKDLAEQNGGVKYLQPHGKILSPSGAKDLRVFVLGPPRDTDRLEDLNPEGDEEFSKTAFSAATAGTYFAAAASGVNGDSPFANRYRIPSDKAMADANFGAFFAHTYGADDIAPAPIPGVREPGKNEVAGNPDWRRIDKDWLYSADQLALAMNDYTNNSSVVLAFELGKGGKVLLFAADAQRGNWVSWSKQDWKDGAEPVKAKDLLARTVFYKVGHHGSHNATLNGKVSDEHPNISWMAEGDYAAEFTAMITAVRAWAETQKGWDHPLKAIKDALVKKAGGRVFQTDCDVSKMTKLKNSPVSDWQDFQSRTRGDRLYFDYEVKA